MTSLPVILILTPGGALYQRGPDTTVLTATDLPYLLDAANGRSPDADRRAEIETLAQRIEEVAARFGPPALTPIATDTPPTIATSIKVVEANEFTEPKPDHTLRAVLPRTAAVTPEGFLLTDRSGQAACVLSAAHLTALLSLGQPDATALPASTLQVLLDAGIVVAEVDEPDAIESRNPLPADPDKMFSRRKTLIASGAELLRRPAAPGKTSVIALHDDLSAVNLALGMLLAYGAHFDDGRLNNSYEFLPVWVTSPKALRRKLDRDGPAVFLFSNYEWTVNQNLGLSALIKELSPESICIHGGPSTPKYEGDAEQFFAANPGVDVAVRGEGEETFAAILDALAGQLAGPDTDLHVLDGVEGLTFRSSDGVVRNPDRARSATLDTFPSPYLTGYFDDLTEGSVDFLPVESNRGCPYGCTFCDWGSATNSRIRKFDLQRVFDEIEFGARNRVQTLFVVDANFGIFARDVEIAAKAVECNKKYGFPREFYCCYAKNTTKYTSQICTMLWEAGIGFFPVVALQSMDEQVLSVVDRSNIKTEAYDEHAANLRGLGATVFTELMLGLPGSSLRSFSADLQGCIDREVYASIYDTMVLPNSPMNAPSYLREHEIEMEVLPVGNGSVKRLVVSSATFTRDDYDVMKERRRAFHIFENAGALRYVARWVRQATGRREIDLFDGLGDASRAEPQRYPLSRWLIADTHFFLPPLSWPQFHREVRDYLTREFGLEPSSEMDTALAVQLAVTPDARRAFPATIDLPHDYGAWYAQVRAAKAADPHWDHAVAPLGSFGPATFTVEGPASVCEGVYGTDLLAEHSKVNELVSPVMRGGRFAPAPVPVPVPTP